MSPDDDSIFFLHDFFLVSRWIFETSPPLASLCEICTSVENVRLEVHLLETMNVGYTSIALRLDCWSKS